MLGLRVHIPVPVENIDPEIKNIKVFNRLNLNGERSINFKIDEDVVFNRQFLPFHPNGIKFTAFLTSGKRTSSTFFSIGGGFVVKEERSRAKKQMARFAEFPFPVKNGADLATYCKQENKKYLKLYTKMKSRYGLKKK